MEKVCLELGCQVAEPTVEFPTAFLGAGSNGRVLRVSKERNNYALKVALDGEKSVLLHKEYAMLKEHEKNCTDDCTLVVRTVGSCVSLNSGFTGCLLSPVGAGITRESMIEGDTIRSVLMALYQLHVHNPLICHGDPRLANLIRKTDDTLMWIDFSHCRIYKNAVDAALIRADAQILVCSILNLSGVDDLKSRSHVLTALSAITFPVNRMQYEGIAESIIGV